MNVDFEPDARLRIDKWLWCARFFKTRSLAAEAVDRGRVEVNGQAVKNSREVKPGDTIVIEAYQQRWEIVVKGIAAARGPAPVAQTLYEETPASVAKREQDAERRRYQNEPTAQLQGRPTKRDRRRIDDFRH
ncbi:RNA-binding S4 domain-containing protein [Cupriavidus plantarum]|uniref:Heat shock protein Hsp15 n=1 Tax=Cupriavidus plantarum TaxID=942865 RepID=A0A316F356_9BURK|nr:RNA-binding S4 domain-containing protein [Cupriavidus plantarum]NYH98421.1 ribosome-associated heat shock protein Hsp15 [Cupriavidus plantarum]PWK37949.1 heat shock protein Hsp15 [Cupriavidus plantarum]REF01352.1 heat shock protein Hsp15 [Cupriavidus plantarum]RLK45789.1 heat shock protein Hsp15 [Cupriavidus plantarum]CAG2127858.1 Heat shock protein 15 [Cupriavidus plantarum]